MKYFVGYIIEGEAVDYYKTLGEDLSKRFGVKNISLTKPLHMTFKAPFESDDIKPFDKRLRELAQREAIPFVLNKFGRFGDYDLTIYLAPAGNEILQKNVDEIANAIYEFGDKRLPTHLPIRLHASIARYLSPELAKKVWEYLETLPAPHFELSFNNIALFIHSEDRWSVESRYPFK
ncbi:MAG: hypothetical protein UW46_C0004G0047 [Candidatus Yanofskybacteria bacterium GW2011_GWF1_44_227]|uniref:2'-5' RNA ligase n=1 Tax=Candidatus Yanofskybacteria bacterium GW2011_GWE2_40_11 TaxID=1619033 RepID=A0A0G0QKB2_9BACT|nr:MAG: hypothetical protein UT75_C0007G0021 [Candidatus Yanofskybacteria bacterium GW2011_GWE2_40_11]KKT15631.1 MAG: hypothetical protein UV97_C0004G0047 [Candidatus Yanofskybacteria bacterium GW2011_GWF2_43_596]KKT53320.1 MAG: hypothetical protein UW46_C0004G0047 [Candidatus Yanofskybacteria bacterium GW2011_GWF1_44_227]OGN35950.1 MAG: hypothetical protein A2207_02730 [Candidatus Yanofskybacteria bacterium RIFOXYA1_FULL_44_17]OGN36448.1 MAG: hypothetical protein A2241_01755 [Candidatus Yanofs